MKKLLIILLGSTSLNGIAQTVTWNNVSGDIYSSNGIYSNMGGGTYFDSNSNTYDRLGNSTRSSSGYTSYDNGNGSISVISPSGNVSVCSTLYNSVTCR
ncbi:hypothetical protein NYR62_01585 [Actinobacillus genomosp. 1]|uniref:hypothetical protein n=1 Tax=Actinobacillus genomosp. 1 TaxID=254839 RepID=UPI0024435094|nr:hypothetical protein [Actinobacillus genomosp. 1]WGE36327.1 hypothetical protein NYR62_01585 [Actinobacillus genomosp. 1]